MTNPVEYAENQLDVHGPWQEAREALVEHHTLSDNLAALRSRLRNLKSEVEDVKMEMITEAPAVYPDLSTTARKEALKLAFAREPKIITLEREIHQAEGIALTLESQVNHLERKIHVLTARMNELDGLLKFYAAAKAAQRPTTGKQ